MGLFDGLVDKIARFTGLVMGSSSIGGKLGRAGAYAGAGLIATEVISNQAEKLRAYYGESRYNSMYGQGEGALNAMFMVPALWFAGTSLIDRDPIKRLSNSGKYWFGGDRAKMLNAATPQNIKDKIKFTPRWGLTQTYIASSFFIPSTLAGNPELMAGAIGVGAVGGIVGGTLFAGKKMGASITGMLRNFASTAVPVGIGIAAGYSIGVRNINPTAEGNITSFDKGDSRISRLNYSTAGLTLALHRQNRVEL